MFLTAYNLPHYLISKGLISAQSVVDGDFVLAEAGRRNRNFKVLRRKQPGLFVKQIKTTEAQAISTIEREAAFYRTVHSDARYATIAQMIPKFIDYEPPRRALTLSLTENAESISEHHMRHAQIPESTARLIGNALGIAHAYGPTMLADSKLRTLFPYQVPWPMTLDQSGYSFLDNFPPIGPQLAAAIRQSPKLQPMLSALRPLWQYDSLIHGDMKWDNCLLSSPDGVQQNLTIVDWELADIGDGAWDVATIFKEYLVAAILNASARQAAASQNQPVPPAQTIESMQPSIRAFWKAYAAARGITADAGRYLDRAVRYTAARMIIAVLEYLNASPQFSVLGSSMLQTAVYLLETPQVAAVQMIGVPLI
jgi:Phosphotransferase enzyme family